jgi:ribokinase
MRSPGGGAITAVAAARLGLETALVAPLGDDLAGEFVRRELEAEGITVGGAVAARTPETIVLPCGDDRAMVTIDPGVRTRTSDLQPHLPARAVACNLEQLHLVPDGTPMYLTCGSDDARAYARRLPEATQRAGGLFVDGPDACLLAGMDGVEAAGAALAPPSGRSSSRGAPRPRSRGSTASRCRSSTSTPAAPSTRPATWT